jgi:hypothetical protein
MKKQFRQRPIDISRAIQIIIGDLPDEDQVEEYEPEEQEPYVPIPEVKEADSKVVDLGEQGESSFTRPPTYIRYFQTWEQERNQIEYDMEETDFDFCKSHSLNPLDFEYLINVYERETGTSPDLIEWHELRGMKSSTRYIFNYWRDRRFSRISRYYPKCGKPLITNYEIPPDPNDSSPFMVFRPREDKPPKKRKNEPEHLVKLEQLKSDFESLLLVMGSVKQREILSKNLTETSLLLNKKQEHPTDIPLFDFISLNTKPMFGFLMECTNGYRWGRGGRLLMDVPIDTKE